MIFDSVMLGAIASEIRGLRDTAIRDIVQDDEGRVVSLQFRESTLQIDTHPQRARLHFSSKTPPSSTRSSPNATPNGATPNVPSAFLQTLRKSLRGARLVQISQPKFDRVLRLIFQSRNEVGEERTHTLMLELMERRSNLILLDGEDIIIDALKRLPPFLNRARTILPHQTYELPPSSQENPLLVKDWRNRVLDAQRGASKDVVWQPISWLREHFTGVSPLVARVLQTQIDETEADFAQICEAFWQRAYAAARGETTPFLCENQPYPFALGENCQPHETTLSALIEECARREEQSQSLASERAKLLSFLVKRAKTNLAQRNDVAKSELHAQDAERFKTVGQLMLTCLSEVENALKENRKTLDLTNESGEVFALDLELDWNASDNAQRFFNRYRRALKLRGNAPERNRVLDTERVHLEDWRYRAQNATTDEELENVARDCGFSKASAPKTVSRTKQQEKSALPESRLRQREIDGWQVWMGRSALENQILLSKVARPSDIWLHVRDAPSAYVLIKNQKGAEPPIRVIEESARWLANVSRKNASGETLEVIYTPAKWVRSVKGAPGRVTLNRFQTLLIST